MRTRHGLTLHEGPDLRHLTVSQSGDDVDGDAAATRAARTILAAGTGVDGNAASTLASDADRPSADDEETADEDDRDANA